MALVLGHDPSRLIDKCFEANNNVYVLYMAQLINTFFAKLVRGEITFRGIKLAYVVDYLQYSDNFKPFEITFMGNASRFKHIESTNVIEYIEKYIICGQDWRPVYEEKTLSVLTFENELVINYEFDECLGLVGKKERSCDAWLCRIGENSFHDGTTNYMNENNNHVEYGVVHGGTVSLVIFDGEMLIVSNSNNGIYYNKTSNEFKITGNVLKFGLLGLFEKEFGLVVPVDLYAKFVRSDEICKVSSGATYVSFGVDGYRLSRYACKYGLFDLFEKEFKMKIPITVDKCEELFRVKKKKTLRGAIRETLMKYFFDYSHFIDKRVLCIDSLNNAKVVVVDRRYVKGCDCECKDLLWVKWNAKCDAYNIVDFVKQFLLELFESISPKERDGELGKMLATFCLTVDTPKFVSVYNLGPYESFCGFDSDKNQTKFTIDDIRTNKRTFDIEMTDGKDFKVLVATEEHLTATGELIVWKGVHIGAQKDGAIAKLIIPKNAAIFQNTEGMKFRTNRCRVEAIYKVDLFECFNCKKTGVFDYKGILYCSGCTTLIIKEQIESKIDLDENIKLIDISKGEEVALANAPFKTFEYGKNQNIEIEDFVHERSNCDKKGIYFFFRLEQVLNYMFVPKLKQTEDKVEEDVKPAENVLRRRSTMIPMETSVDSPGAKPKDDKCSIQ
ncbi:MAG: hypothetical protein Harvfovirus35_3 [Harvfovirus sp.]|uniref:Uncharacterized protein n=1 Tax=Harvfovirus sp. TaxID=2487768 RepID=A0A3G5A4P0_9VIRU|nr:MAG: hypothetical protein Harvfovirus35_3 [Harvfovirus sp.]